MMFSSAVRRRRLRDQRPVRACRCGGRGRSRRCRTATGRRLVSCGDHELAPVVVGLRAVGRLDRLRAAHGVDEARGHRAVDGGVRRPPGVWLSSSSFASSMHAAVGIGARAVGRHALAGAGAVDRADVLGRARVARRAAAGARPEAVARAHRADVDAEVAGAALRVRGARRADRRGSPSRSRSRSSE